MVMLKKIFSNILKYFFNTRAAGLYIILFAAAIGIATFIENDYGTSAAQKLIFQSWWFELLLVLFGISILVNIFKFRMIQQKKWPLLLFHAAILIILFGAGITRYFGYEGIMHIRENETSNQFLSSNSYLKFEVNKQGTTYTFDEPILFASKGNNHWKSSYLIDNDLIEIEVLDFIPNPSQQLISSPNGKPTLKIVIAGANGRENYFIQQGEIKRFGSLIFNFSTTEIEEAITIRNTENGLQFKTNKAFTQMVMATQQRDTISPTGDFNPLLLRSLYSDGINNFVISEFNENGQIELASDHLKLKNESLYAIKLNVSVNKVPKDIFVYGSKGNPGKTELLQFNELDMGIAYGSKVINLPFSIQLKKFILETYPGTESASSYASEVLLLDEPNDIKMDFRIFMNNILNYDGYRFFQSSFDKDEKGTYLSVNHDYWGTFVSYLGYILLTIGMIWTLFSKNTRFHQVIQKIKTLREKSSTFILVIFFLFCGPKMFSQSHEKHILHTAIQESHAELFSTLIVQDFKGRMKPMHTLTREVMRKIYRKETYNGLTADQIMLSMLINNKDWYGEKIIKLGKHKDVLALLGVDTEYAAYKDFFKTNGEYKLRDEVRRIYNMVPKDRGVYEKEILKIDERLNILSMVFSGSLLKIIPVTEDINNTWIANHTHGTNHDAHIASSFFEAYSNALEHGVSTNNYSNANQLLNELKTYQITQGANVIPSQTKINAEIILNKLNVFNRLALFYFVLGIAFLCFLFVSVFKPNLKLKKIYLLLFALVVFGFILHSIGLGLRWYVSGRAPWSNGYESMIYIAWTTTLAGIIFTRKSFGGLAATMVLAATILLVSMLSFLDPEITPLVPVLKSYWLTIHVSLEAGSYGFLMLGAIIGIINLILMIFTTETNKLRVKAIITEMSYLSELTITGGLIMVSIGTYLGGVWANESWGRYWGWDAKETWALVTILVYAFILHMRIIPKLTGLYLYNVSTIFGLATVIMTYYGVNYYLSGLHSYATGDPIPIPKWVYIVVLTLFIISVLAYYKKRKIKMIN